MGRPRSVAIAVLCLAALAVAVFVVRSRTPRAQDNAQASSSATGAAGDGETDGMYGFTHESSSLIDGKMVVTMKEGPDGPQVRCQTEALPCSYLEMKALVASGAEVPPSLKMTRDELKTLVSQLDIVSKHLERYQNNITQACLDGYRTRSPQVANMGFHMGRPGFNHDGTFDLEKPEILLFARDGAEQLTQDKIGDCVDGKWTGNPDQHLVGAAFLQFVGPHPEGFAGPLDNWHIHYNVCLGAKSASTLSKEECLAHGGIFQPDTGWMVHAFVVPEYDDQLGVFSQWNPSVWPKAPVNAMPVMGHDMAAMKPGESMPGHDMSGHDMAGHSMPGAAAAPGRESVIFEFQFSPIEINAGDTVTFRNADPVFHTVTAGTQATPSNLFDSGRMFADQTFRVTLDKPGVYPIFCRLHEDMTGTIVVK